MVLKHELWKTGLPPLTTRVSDVFSGFPIQPMQLLLKYDSELALHRSCCCSSKQDGSISSGMWQGRATFITCSEPYIRRSAGWPKTGDAAQDVTSHTATDPESRPSAAQPRTELSLATRPRSRTMEAACGNGYAPVLGLPVMIIMMMMMMMCF